MHWMVACLYTHVTNLPPVTCRLSTFLLSPESAFITHWWAPSSIILLLLFSKSQIVIVILFSPLCVITIKGSTMPYYEVIKANAKSLVGLGSAATENNLLGLYLGVLVEWFPISKGYIVDRQVLNRARKPGRKSFFIRHAGYLDPLLIVELKRPAKWNDAGKQEVLGGLTKSIQMQFAETQYSTIYGIGAIGLHWMACKMEKDGLPVPTTLLDWHDDITSDSSYNAFKAIADLVYNIH